MFDNVAAEYFHAEKYNTEISRRKHCSVLSGSGGELSCFRKEAPPVTVSSAEGRHLEGMGKVQTMQEGAVQCAGVPSAWQGPEQRGAGLIRSPPAKSDSIIFYFIASDCDQV